MTTRTANRQMFLSDIIITAVEGGAVDYWADVSHYNSSDFNASFLLTWEGGAKVVTTNEIARGINKIIKGECQVSDSIKGWIVEDNKENDASNIDALAADCIIQAAVLGELVYG